MTKDKKDIVLVCSTQLVVHVVVVHCHSDMIPACLLTITHSPFTVDFPPWADSDYTS